MSRLQSIADGAEEDADMVINVLKTVVMHIKKQDKVKAEEQDYEDFAASKSAVVCSCGEVFDSEAGC